MDTIPMIRKTLLLAAVLAAPCFLFAQKAPNSIDENGLKQGEWAKYNAQGQLIYTGAFSDDKPTGLFTYFFEDETKKAELTYEDGEVLKALSKTFHRNGKVMSEGTYVNKNRDGEWKFYDEDEKLISEEYYDNGLKTGIWKVYYYNGTLNEETTYENDRKNGPWKQYFTDGTLKVAGTYVNDLLEGESVYYHPDGKVMVRGSYVKNLKHGKWVFFDQDGTMVKEQEYTMGKLPDDPQ